MLPEASHSHGHPTKDTSLEALSAAQAAQELLNGMLAEYELHFAHRPRLTRNPTLLQVWLEVLEPVLAPSKLAQLPQTIRKELTAWHQRFTQEHQQIVTLQQAEDRAGRAFSRCWERVTLFHRRCLGIGHRYAHGAVSSVEQDYMEQMAQALQHTIKALPTQTSQQQRQVQSLTQAIADSLTWLVEQPKQHGQAIKTSKDASATLRASLIGCQHVAELYEQTVNNRLTWSLHPDWLLQLWMRLEEWITCLQELLNQAGATPQSSPQSSLSARQCLQIQQDLAGLRLMAEHWRQLADNLAAQYAQVPLEERLDAILQEVDHIFESTEPALRREQGPLGGYHWLLLRLDVLEIHLRQLVEQHGTATLDEALAMVLDGLAYLERLRSEQQ